MVGSPTVAHRISRGRKPLVKPELVIACENPHCFGVGPIVVCILLGLDRSSVLEILS